MIAGTGLASYFGIISAIDCADDLWIAGTLGLVIGMILGGMIAALIKYLYTKRYRSDEFERSIEDES